MICSMMMKKWPSILKSSWSATWEGTLMYLVPSAFVLDGNRHVFESGFEVQLLE